MREKLLKIVIRYFFNSVAFLVQDSCMCPRVMCKNRAVVSCFNTSSSANAVRMHGECRNLSWKRSWQCGRFIFFTSFLLERRGAWFDLQVLCGVLAKMPLLNFVSMTLDPCAKREMPWVFAQVLREVLSCTALWVRRPRWADKELCGMA